MFIFVLYIFRYLNFSFFCIIVFLNYNFCIFFVLSVDGNSESDKNRELLGRHPQTPASPLMLGRGVPTDSQ